MRSKRTQKKPVVHLDAISERGESEWASDVSPSPLFFSAGRLENAQS